MAKRIRTTYTFQGSIKANKFVDWLKKFTWDSDYGCPQYVDLRDVGHGEWCVEYEYNGNNQLARGVAIGIDFAPTGIEYIKS